MKLSVFHANAGLPFSFSETSPPDVRGTANDRVVVRAPPVYGYCTPKLYCAISHTRVYSVAQENEFGFSVGNALALVFKHVFGPWNGAFLRPPRQTSRSRARQGRTPGSAAMENAIKSNTVRSR